MSTATMYHRLGLRPFINARGTITTLGGSIMPPEVVDAMVEASRQFVLLDELHEKAGARIARLTRAEGAFIPAGAASGMFLAGAACMTGEDPETIRRIPDTGNLPNEFVISLFVISLVDGHYYIHQGFQVCGGTLVKVGTGNPLAERITPTGSPNAPLRAYSSWAASSDSSFPKSSR